MERRLKTDTSGSEKKISSCEVLAFNLLHSVTVIHIAHLGITGPGSFATHKALDEYYSGIGDLADDFVEQYQGITGKLFEYPTQGEVPVLKDANSCLSYLKNLRSAVDKEQKVCPYSEINNILDEVKSLIDSTCYKLTFLK